MFFLENVVSEFYSDSRSTSQKNSHELEKSSDSYADDKLSQSLSQMEITHKENMIKKKKFDFIGM